MGDNSGGSKMTNEEKIDLNKKIDIGVRRAAARAQAEHKKAGRSIFIWEDGKVVEVPPEKINLPEEKVNSEKGQ
jgi:hypothetical protein